MEEICYMRRDIARIVKTYEGKREWVSELLENPRFIPKHRVDYFKRVFDVKLPVIETFIDDYSDNFSWSLREKFLKENVFFRINAFVFYCSGKAHLKVDYDQRLFWFNDVCASFDTKGFYVNGKLVAYINMSFFNLLKTFEAL